LEHWKIRILKIENWNNGTIRVVGAIHLPHRDELPQRTADISAMNVRFARRIARVTDGEFRPTHVRFARRIARVTIERWNNRKLEN
jgi:hypothetical protein